MRNKRPFTFFILIVAMSCTMISDGFSQVGLNINLWTVADGNTFRNYENLADVIYQPNITLFYDHSNSKGGARLLYEGSAFLFNEFTTRQYHYHNLGITGNRSMGESGPVLLWGIRGGKRYNKDEYKYYDYKHAQGYLNLRFDGNGIWVLGALVRFQDYEELSQFSFWETQGFIRGSFFLKTRTTIIGRMQAGFKKFTESLISEEIILETVSGGMPGNGHGQGRNNNQSGNEQTLTRIMQVESSRDGVFQWIGSLRLAQSIGVKTGLAIEGTIHRNPKGGSRVLSGQDSGYETNDILFDDPYSYNSDKISLELTQMLPWNTQLKLGAESSLKRYDRPAYDLEGSPIEELLRRDTLKTGWISIRKTIPLKGFVKGLIVFLYYNQINNTSNDEFFKYTNRMTGLGCNFSL